MGGGAWDDFVYASTTGRSVADPTTGGFVYSHAVMTGRLPFRVHADLDAMHVNRAGERVRESRDSDEHPRSTPIAVLFDVTGSMGGVPRELVRKLPELYGLLLRKGYVEHPQVMFGAIGDATTDRVPLQFGQFESDNRADGDLLKMVLEGGGGGQTTESYELAAYFMARHTAIDSWERRGRKGYVFFIGDEQPYPQVDPLQVRELIGDDLAEAIGVDAIFAELSRRYHVFYILPAGASYQRGDPSFDRINGEWRRLLGQNVIELDDLDAVCETIALRIGLEEGTIDLDHGLDDLRELGAPDSSIRSASKALATVAASGGIVEGDLPSDLADDGAPGDEGIERL